MVCFIKFHINWFILDTFGSSGSPKQGGCGPSAQHIQLVGWSVEKVTKNKFAGPSKLGSEYLILSYKGQITCINDPEYLQSQREAFQSKEM